MTFLHSQSLFPCEKVFILGDRFPRPVKLFNYYFLILPSDTGISVYYKGQARPSVTLTSFRRWQQQLIPSRLDCPILNFSKLSFGLRRRLNSYSRLIVDELRQIGCPMQFFFFFENSICPQWTHGGRLLK